MKAGASPGFVSAISCLSLVLVPLLACKSKSNVTGSIAFDGVNFEPSDCQVSHATSNLGGSVVTTQTVTIVDSHKRRLSFSNSGGMRVSIWSGSLFDTIGSGCGSLRVTGSGAAATGHVEADCTGSGHTVRANFDFANCGQYGIGP